MSEMLPILATMSVALTDLPNVLKALSGITSVVVQTTQGQFRMLVGAASTPAPAKAAAEPKNKESRAPRTLGAAITEVMSKGGRDKLDPRFPIAQSGHTYGYVVTEDVRRQLRVRYREARATLGVTNPELLQKISRDQRARLSQGRYNVLSPALAEVFDMLQIDYKSLLTEQKANPTVASSTLVTPPPAVTLAPASDTDTNALGLSRKYQLSVRGHGYALNKGLWKVLMRRVSALDRTYADMAARAGVSPSVIAHFCNTPGVGLGYRMVQVLKSEGVEYEDLLIPAKEPSNGTSNGKNGTSHEQTCSS